MSVSYPHLPASQNSYKGGSEVQRWGKRYEDSHKHYPGWVKQNRRATVGTNFIRPPTSLIADLCTDLAAFHNTATDYWRLYTLSLCCGKWRGPFSLILRFLWGSFSLLKLRSFHFCSFLFVVSPMCASIFLPNLRMQFDLHRKYFLSPLSMYSKLGWSVCHHMKG